MGGVRRFYRVVTSQVPTERDFYSPRRRGRKLRPPVTPELLRSFRSVSVWDTFESAVRAARDYPKLGQYVAVLDLPAHVAPVRSGVPGHWDIEAEASELLQAVEQVVPIATVEDA